MTYIFNWFEIGFNWLAHFGLIYMLLFPDVLVGIHLKL